MPAWVRERAGRGEGLCRQLAEAAVQWQGQVMRACFRQAAAFAAAAAAHFLTVNSPVSS